MRLPAELRDSREECASRIGRSVTALAYPYGDVDERVGRATREAGYDAAAAMVWPSRPIDPMRHPRIGVYHKDSWRRFRLKVGRWSRSTYASRLISLRAAHADRS